MLNCVTKFFKLENPRPALRVAMLENQIGATHPLPAQFSFAEQSENIVTLRGRKAGSTTTGAHCAATLNLICIVLRYVLACPIVHSVLPGPARVSPKQSRAFFIESFSGQKVDRQRAFAVHPGSWR